MKKNLPPLSSAFTLVEVLAAVAIIGIITFLAIPNILQIRADSEQSLAISRAEGLNMAMASFVQARGRTAAETAWTGNDEAKFDLVAPYLSFAQDALTNYMPGGYTAAFPGTLTTPLTKVTLTGPSSTNAIDY